MSECKTYLVFHVDERLRVVFNEAANYIARILTREDLLNQGGEFIRSKRASNQPFAGWSVEVDMKKVPGASVLCTRAAKLHQSRRRTTLGPGGFAGKLGTNGGRAGSAVAHAEVFIEG